MKIKKFGVAALLAITVSAFTGTCFAIEESDLNIGGIYLGQPIKEVIAQIGKPISKEKLKDKEFGYIELAHKRYKYDFVKNGAKFTVIADRNVKGVIVNKTAEAAGLATKAGISLGATGDDVLKAYGTPLWDVDRGGLIDDSLSRIMRYRKRINGDEEQLLFSFMFDLNGKLVNMDYIQRSIYE